MSPSKQNRPGRETWTSAERQLIREARAKRVAATSTTEPRTKGFVRDRDVWTDPLFDADPPLWTKEPLERREPATEMAGSAGRVKP